MDFIYLLMSCAVTAFIIVAIVDAVQAETCHKICVYKQGSENCKNMPCQTGIKHWLERESK